MKKIALFLIALLLVNIGFAQEPEKKLNLRGPVKPLDLTYANYKTYSLKSNLHAGIEKSLKSKKVAYSQSTIESDLQLAGFKKTDDGDFKITYNVTRFELVENESYVKSTFQKSPAYYIGIESNVEIKDKDGKLIFQRFFPPKVNLFVTDPQDTYEILVRVILENNFKFLISEFDSYYLYGPVLKDLRYFEIEKAKKSKSDFNAEEFNQSIKVFPTLIDVDRSNWPGLFSEAQTYWKKFLNYTEPKDEGLQKRVRFAANYSLAATYLLLGQEKEAEKYLTGIKENESSFLGMRTHSPYIKETVDRIEAYRNSTDKAAGIEAIAAQPELPSYKSAETVFRYAEFDGQVEDTDSKVFKGKIRIISDSPELVDFRTKSSGSSSILSLSGADVDNSTVLIFDQGEKKPERTSLKRLNHIKDSEGRIYYVGKTGRSSMLSANPNATSTKRYSLFEEVKKSNKLSLYHEFFPQDDYVLKKAGQPDFYTPPASIGRRKSLKTFFADCPKMMEKIDKGEYDFDTKNTYLKIFEDYTNACKGK